MKKNVNQKSNSQNEYYLIINGEKIRVSEQVYCAYKRPVWAERKRKERDRKCRNAKGNYCTGKCESCPYFIDGKHGGTVSLDRLSENGYEVPASDDVADIVMYGILLEKLCEELKKLAPTDELILRLFGNGMSEREISKVLKERSQTDSSIQGLSQKSVNLHKTSLFIMLRERLKDYR